MKNENESHHPIDRWSYVWLGIGTLLMVFIGGSWPLSLAGWLASMFMLRFIRTQKTFRGYILVLVGLTIANTIAWRVQNPTPFPAFVFGTLTGSYVSLAFLADRLIVPRFKTDNKGNFVVTLVFPLILTASQFLFFNNFLFGSYGAWAYSQHDNLNLLQLVSITGIWGVIFLIGWFASVVNWAWERTFSWPEIRRGAVIFSGIFFLALAYGNLRLVFSPTNADAVRIHSITEVEEFGVQLFTEDMIPLAQTNLPAFRSMSEEINNRYLEGTIREAKAGAQIVVWPEGAAFGIKEDIDDLIERGQEVAREEKIYLVMGIFIINPEKDINPSELLKMRLLIADPSGEIVLNHLKYAYGLGDPLSEVELQTVDTPYGRMSGILCGDMDIPNIVKQAGQKNVDILFNPSQENIIEDSAWHVRFAYFRAVENGVSVVRPTAGGMSVAIDPYGRTLASMDHFSTADRVMIAHVPTRSIPTLYPMVGNFFGWLTVAGFMVITGWAIFRGFQVNRAEANPSETVNSANV